MRRFLKIPNRLPVRLPERQVRQKWVAAAAIAALATLVAVGWRHTKVISDPMEALDDLLYDVVYRTRTPEDRTNGPVVIVAIDERSIESLASGGTVFEDPVAWPWPRELYGDMVQYFERCGARVVAFDILFNQLDRQSLYGSDETFAELVAESKVPVVFGNYVQSDGRPGPFAVPIKSPIFGAVNAPGGVLRVFQPLVNGFPSLGYRAATIYAGREPAMKERFFTRYYGPHRMGEDRFTYRYVSALRVIAASQGRGDEAGLSPEIFRDKIVLVGGTALALADAKLIPLKNSGGKGRDRHSYPGVEWQATAIDNLLLGHQVLPVPLWSRITITLAAAFFAASGALLPRRTIAKVVAALLVGAGIVLLGVTLFRGETIRWLPMANPITAVLMSTVGGFAWGYFTEGRDRQFISKALGLATSPVIAEAISRNPEKVKLGGERRDITVMFTDLAGFTDLSETMEVVKLAQVINLYMEAMSDEIVRQDGYLDKYIGDAIMSFWNGIVDQPDHAARACRAALAVKRRELEIAPELQKLVEARIVTRIGINTGPMAVGNLGSSRKMSYTVLGDAVNLGARLEPANKIYGSEVIISQTVAEQVRGQFVMRELDLLRVKGKQKPMGVYELLAEGPLTAELRARVELYADALEHYRAQRWNDAEGSLLRLLRDLPNDAPAAALLKRVAKLRHETLEPNWDGVYVAKEK